MADPQECVQKNRALSSAVLKHTNNDHRHKIRPRDLQHCHQRTTQTKACSKGMPHTELGHEAGPTISTQCGRMVTMSTMVWSISHTNLFVLCPQPKFIHRVVTKHCSITGLKLNFCWRATNKIFREPWFEPVAFYHRTFK